MTESQKQKVYQQYLDSLETLDKPSKVMVMTISPGYSTFFAGYIGKFFLTPDTLELAKAAYVDYFEQRSGTELTFIDEEAFRWWNEVLVYENSESYMGYSKPQEQKMRLKKEVFASFPKNGIFDFNA